LEYVMTKGCAVMAAGAAFSIVGGAPTMIKSTKPVIAVCATRTGSGKSQTTRRVCEILRAMGGNGAELPRHNETSFCCGGGGGRMFLEESTGQRISEMRIERAIATKAQTVATACPIAFRCSRMPLKLKALKNPLKCWILPNAWSYCVYEI
jgi:hypothetical protein